MTAEQLFSILNLIAVAAWLPLVFLPRVRWTTTVLPVVMPLLLAVIYLVLVAATLPWSEGGFSSLVGVKALFDNPWALLAGWTHYLAFDLFIGGWEVRDAQRRGIPHLLIVPALVLTFLLGPVGLLLYLAVRWFEGRRRCRLRQQGARSRSDGHASRGHRCCVQAFTCIQVCQSHSHVSPRTSPPPNQQRLRHSATSVIVLPEWMKQSCRPTPF